MKMSLSVLHNPAIALLDIYATEMCAREHQADARKKVQAALFIKASLSPICKVRKITPPPRIVVRIKYHLYEALGAPPGAW